MLKIRKIRKFNFKIVRNLKDKEKKLKDILIVQNISPIDRLEKSFYAKKLEYINEIRWKEGREL